MRPHLEELSNIANVFISAYPNAGLPNEFGQYDETAHETAHQVDEFMKAGLVNIVGGCCGTTPEHIKCIADKAAKYPARKKTGDSTSHAPERTGSGYANPESVFMNVGERTNITGSPKFSKLDFRRGL